MIPPTFVRRREPLRRRAPAILVNERVPDQIAAHQAPSGPRRGETPARPAMSQIAFSFHPPNIAGTPWQEDSLTFGKQRIPIMARQIRGRQMPWGARFNIRRPGTTAFGDQFEYYAED